jgi:hypothetical protein
VTTLVVGRAQRVGRIQAVRVSHALDALVCPATPPIDLAAVGIVQALDASAAGYVTERPAPARAVAVVRARIALFDGRIARAVPARVPWRACRTTRTGSGFGRCLLTRCIRRGHGRRRLEQTDLARRAGHEQKAEQGRAQHASRIPGRDKTHSCRCRSSNRCRSCRYRCSGCSRGRTSPRGRIRCNSRRWTGKRRRSACRSAAAADTCPGYSRSCSSRRSACNRIRSARTASGTRACRRRGCTRRGSSRRWSYRRRLAVGRSRDRSRSDRWTRCRPRSNRGRCRWCNLRRWDGSRGSARRSRIRRALDRRCSSSTPNSRCRARLRRRKYRRRSCRFCIRVSSSRALFRSSRRRDGRSRCSGARVGRSPARSGRCSTERRPCTRCFLRRRRRSRRTSRRRKRVNSSRRGACTNYPQQRTPRSSRPRPRPCPRCRMPPRCPTRRRGRPAIRPRARPSHRSRGSSDLLPCPSRSSR